MGEGKDCVEKKTKVREREVWVRGKILRDMKVR